MRAYLRAGDLEGAGEIYVALVKSGLRDGSDTETLGRVAAVATNLIRELPLGKQPSAAVLEMVAAGRDGGSQDAAGDNGSSAPGKASGATAAEESFLRILNTQQNDGER